MDKREFEEFIEINGTHIFNFCYRLAMDIEKAEELYQDTMLKAYEEREKIQLEQYPKAFVYSIAIGKWKNMKRKIWRSMNIFQQSSEEQLLNIEDGKSVEDIVMKKELQNFMDNIFMSMKDKMRIPMIMYYKYDYSVSQIAMICKVPEGTIKSRLYKARILMEKELVKGGYYEGKS